jgi:hypothetical protein
MVQLKNLENIYEKGDFILRQFYQMERFKGFQQKLTMIRTKQVGMFYIRAMVIFRQVFLEILELDSKKPDIQNP